MTDISEGDTVMLVDACCEKPRGSIGWIGRVERLAVVLNSECKFCGFVTFGMHAAITIEQPGYVPTRWLRKMSPPAEVECVREPELLEIRNVDGN